ncbi:MAG: ribonuclease III [Pseudohongiellaceae bacterium]|nr:ribonuclease III [Pseudohongiellaceae bacterium]
MTDNVRKLEQILGYDYSDKSLATLALTHRSADQQNNERLEFLGDAVLGFIVADELVQRFPTASEGDLSRRRAALVNQKCLSQIARRLGLGELLTLGMGEQKSGGRQRASILADVVEAILGAIYLDAGLQRCRDLLLQLYGEELDALPNTSAGKDAKTRLQEHLQAKALPLPKYKIESIEGEEHRQSFRVSCRIKLLSEPTYGTGSNRRIAERNAAEKALESLGL